MYTLVPPTPNGMEYWYLHLRHAALLYLCSSDACLLYVLVRAYCMYYWYAHLWGKGICVHTCPRPSTRLRCRPPPSEGGGLLLAREIRHLLSLPLSRMGTLGRPHTPAPLLG